MGVLAYDMGRLEDSIRLYRQALELDPLSSPNYNILGLALHRADRWTEAENAYRKALELAPQRATTHANLSLSLLAQGRREEALAEATAEPALWSRLMALAMIHHTLGQTEESEAALQNLIAKQPEAMVQIAEVYGFRGEVDSAFEWLERAFVDNDPGLSEIKSSPPLRALHGDPRWGPFLRRMGFEE
jgi:tetratricopeptide (TPR) repeat protein